MQLWQQQLMNKQSQELHRQQQLQQLDQGPWQSSPLSQLSGVANPATGNQLSTPLTEMPINDSYNYMWPNNFVGGISNLPSHTQMFIAGNRNLMQSSSSAAMQNFANDVITSNDQSQAMQSMGFVPQEINQSFHGRPVSGTSSVNQYSRFLGMSNNYHDLMTKANANEADKASYPYSTAQSYQQSAAQSCLQDKTLSVQNYPGKHIFGNSLLQNLGNDVTDVTSGNFQQANNTRYSDQFDEFHGRQEQGDSSGNLQEKPVSEVGSSSGVASLDPIEQKILFGSDNDNWGFSFGGSLFSGMGEDMHGHTLENDHYGSFPSIHSGSWSALMQEAVQASSSDKGLPEEWSGLCFQKTEQVMAKPSVPINVNRKQPAAWDDSNLQSVVTSVTSRSFPLFNDANATQNSSTSPSNKNFSEFAHEENDRILTEAPQASFKLSTQGSNNKEFCQNQDQTKLAEDGLLRPRPSSSGLWVGKTIEQHEEIQFQSKDMGGCWGDQQNLPLSDAPSGWNSSYPTASRSNNTLNYQENSGNLWKMDENRVYVSSAVQSVKSDSSSPKIAEYSLASNFGSVRNPNALKLNQNKHQQVTNEQKSVFGKHFAPNTCMSSEGDKDVEENQNQPGRSSQGWATSLNATAERLCNTHENEKEHGRVDSGKGYIEDAAKEKSLLTSNDQYPFMSGSQKSSIQYGQHTVGSRINTIPVYASSSSFNASTVQYSQIETTAQASISAQQRQAGTSPLLTPNVLQFIINHDRDTSLLGLPKAGDQVDKEVSTPEVGSSSVNSQKGEVNPAQGKSLNLIQTEKVDVTPKSGNASHSVEELLKPPLEVVPNVSISSLRCLQQDPALRSQVFHAPPASIVSSSSDLDISGCMLKPSDIQQQKYPLLHQIQSMKASDINKMTGNIPRGTAFSSNTSQVNINMDQGFDHWQNAVYRFSADGKVGAASHILLPSDAKMLSADSSDIEEKNPSTSIAGRPDLHTHTHPLSTNSTANVFGGSERTWISPRIAPFWFEHYGTYKNGRMVALCDAQRSGKAAIQQPFVQKFPARMDDTDVVEQKLDSSHGSSYGHGTSAIKTDPKRSSPFLLAQNVMDHDIILRTKKRKSEITDTPWHKIITVCPERSQSIRC
ncbi:hypothetical protein BHM03_00017441 [Ensete ventricosum]|nr:hypothetical protein BHM03_00017441 [Ensete ventricosum]